MAADQQAPGRRQGGPQAGRDGGRTGQEKIVNIVAVPPLVNNSLTHEADNLQGAFAQVGRG